MNCSFILALMICRVLALPAGRSCAQVAGSFRSLSNTAVYRSQTPPAPTTAAGPAASQPSNTNPPAADPAAALDFLGSYSAPQAVLATETGHTSSRPPSAATDRRLADIGAGLGDVPSDAAEARRRLVQMLAPGDHSPDDWFRAGTTALGAARADSRRLAEIAPSSDWNRRFQAEALATRYPLIARSLWPNVERANKSSSNSVTAPAPNGADGQVSSFTLSRWGTELDALDKGAENPETLYQRARLLVDISGAAYKLAAAAPALDARLFALEALAAEEENDEGAALGEYHAGLAKYPQSGLLHAGLGHLYRQRNELVPARAELDAARRLLPSDALVAFDLGDVELRMGSPELALEALNRALDLDSSLLVARWSRGRAYVAVGGDDNNQRALEDLEAAQSCDTSGTLQWQLSQVYGKLGRKLEAREAEQKSLEQRRAAAQQKRAAKVKSP